VVDLPKGAQANPVPIVVRLDQAGKLFLQQEELPLSELASRLAPAALLQPFGLRRVYFKVDGDVTHAAAVGVLDEIRVAGERACRAFQARPGMGATDGGGDIKVVITLLRR